MGFWASIKEILMKGDWQHKDEKFGIHSFFGYSLAEMRDRVIGKETI